MEFQAEAATFYVSFGQDAFVLLVPMQGEKRWRLIGNLPEYDAQVDREVSFEEVEDKVKQLVQRSLEITTLRWFSTYKVHTRHAETFAAGRCFLAGDATHVHTPAGGQGMNTGIQDAYNLAWKLAFVVKGYVGDSLLDSYSEERLANAKQLLHTTDQTFDLMSGSQWYMQVFRANVLPSLAGFVTKFSAAKEFLFPIVSEIGLNYRNSSLSQHQHDRASKVKAGDRMPYFLADGANVYEKLRDPKFHLLIFSDGQQSYEGLKLQLEAEYGDLIDFNVIPLYPHVAQLFGIEQSFEVLLRPDNYIGLISTDVALTDLKTYFNKLIGQA
jgi:hypothetical protein